MDGLGRTSHDRRFSMDLYAPAGLDDGSSQATADRLQTVSSETAQVRQRYMELLGIGQPFERVGSITVGWMGYWVLAWRTSVQWNG